MTRAAFPEGVNAPVQYGERLAATAVYLQTAHFLPEERLAEVLARPVPGSGLQRDTGGDDPQGSPRLEGVPRSGCAICW